MTSKRLGRGLDFLIGSQPPSEDEDHQDSILHVPIAELRPNPFQPRSSFDEEKIEELSQSIRKNGVIQPLLVRRDGPSFDLVAGERRLKACTRIGRKTVPVIVLDLSDDRLLEIALIENLQREDLNAIEEAHAFQSMVSARKLTHEEIARILGKHRSYVSNTIRLLELPEEIRQQVSRGTLTAGHARALLGLSGEKEMLAMSRRVVEKALSVRETEELVRLANRGRGPTPPRRRSTLAPHLQDLEVQLRNRFNRKVEIRPQGRGGRVTFLYHSEQDLSRLLETLSRDERDGMSREEPIL